MYRFQITEADYQNNHWTAGFKNIEIVKDWHSISPSIPVITKSDVLYPEVRTWLNQQQPAVYIGRGYLGNHILKQRLWWRASINGWANTKLMPIPYSRWGRLNLPKHPWKVDKIKNVLIAPSKMTSSVWSPEVAFTWAESIQDKFPGANVRIRPKIGKPGLRWSSLWKDFEWADLVVSQASAITCEAFWYGKKVISIEPCPTWAAEKHTLDNWQDPTEPKLRDLWHEHLAWSQYTLAEWSSGDAFSLIEQYLGPIVNYKSGHTYALPVTPAINRFNVSTSDIK
jgi:hypothetical protein